MTGVETFIAANAVALSYASAAAGVASAAFQALQGYQQNQAASARAEYEKSVALRNEQIARQNAVLERRAGDERMADQRREVRRRLATIRNNIGANGLGAFGSPLEVLADTAAEGELSVQRIGHSAIQQARAHELEALGHVDAANLARAEAGKTSRAAAFFGGALGVSGAAASGIGGIAQASSFSSGATTGRAGSRQALDSGFY